MRTTIDINMHIKEIAILSSFNKHYSNRLLQSVLMVALSDILGIRDECGYEED